MEIFNLEELDKFIRKHRTAKNDIENWKALVENSDWQRPDDIKRVFRVRFITVKREKRLVFKLGDRWRIDTKIAYNTRKVFVIRVGTHEEYNKWKYKD